MPPTRGRLSGRRGTTGSPGHSAETASERAAATRHHLLDIAARRFAAQGYAATSLRDLIEASGLSKGAFYFHFASKRDLAVEVFRAKQDQLIAAVTAAMDPERPALEQLRQVWSARALAVASDPGVGSLRRLAAALAEDPALERELSAFHARPIELIGGLLAQAQRDGEVRADVDPERAAQAAFAGAIGLDEVSQRETGMADLLERSDAFLEIFLHGVTQQ